MALEYLQAFIKPQFSNVGIVKSRWERNAMSSKHAGAQLQNEDLWLT